MSPETIIAEVERDFCLRPGTLVSRDRTGAVSEARRLAVTRLYSETDLSLSAMGRLLGRHHATIYQYLAPTRLRGVA